MNALTAAGLIGPIWRSLKVRSVDQKGVMGGGQSYLLWTRAERDDGMVHPEGHVHGEDGKVRWSPEQRRALSAPRW